MVKEVEVNNEKRQLVIEFIKTYRPIVESGAPVTHTGINHLRTGSTFECDFWTLLQKLLEER